MLKRKLPGIAQLLNNTFSLTEYLLFRTHFPICQFCALPREAQRAAEEQSEALGSQSKQEDVLVTVQHTADWFEKKGSGWAINAAVLYFIFGETPEPPGTARHGTALTWHALPAGVRLAVGGVGRAGRAVVHPAQQRAQVAHRDLLDEGRPVLAEVPPLEDLQHTHTRTSARRSWPPAKPSPPRPAPCSWVASEKGLADVKNLGNKSHGTQSCIF